VMNCNSFFEKFDHFVIFWEIQIFFKVGESTNNGFTFTTNCIWNF
jgi:hypothetical protein